LNDGFFAISSANSWILGSYEWHIDILNIFKYTYIMKLILLIYIGNSDQCTSNEWNPLASE
jgi:hypothetical protein